MRAKLVILLTAAGLAALAASPAGGAVAGVVRHALFADNAGKVGGLRASATPKPGRLLALGANGKFPSSVVPPAAGPAGPRGPAGPKGDKGDPAFPTTITVVTHPNVGAGMTATATATCPVGYLATGGAVDTADPAREYVMSSTFVLNNGETAQQSPSGQGPSAYGWSGTVRYTGAKALESFTVAAICARAG
jgi:hypothetical protein